MTEAETPAKAKGRAKSPKAAAGKATVTLRQIASAAGRQSYQRATLKGLGLDKINRVSTLQDTPSVRGMIARVHHLIRIESGS